MEPEQVQFVLVEMRTEFDTRDDADPELCTGGGRFGDTVDGVMIGERDGVQLRVTRRLDDPSGRQRAVGCGRVNL